MALKGHLQRTRENVEEDPIPLSPLFMVEQEGESADGDATLAKTKIEESGLAELSQSLKTTSVKAIELIAGADDLGETWLSEARSESGSDASTASKKAAAVDAYKKAFAACAEVLTLDKHAFQASWFKSFWRRNYDSLMVLSLYETLRDDVDNVRKWMDALKGGAEVLAIFKKVSWKCVKCCHPRHFLLTRRRLSRNRLPSTLNTPCPRPPLGTGILPSPSARR